MLCVRTLVFQDSPEVVQDRDGFILKDHLLSRRPGPVLPGPGPPAVSPSAERGVGLGAIPLPSQGLRVLRISRLGPGGVAVTPQGTKDRAILVEEGFVEAASVKPWVSLPTEDPWAARERVLH